MVANHLPYKADQMLRLPEALRTDQPDVSGSNGGAKRAKNPELNRRT